MCDRSITFVRSKLRSKQREGIIGACQAGAWTFTDRLIRSTSCLIYILPHARMPVSGRFYVLSIAVPWIMVPPNGGFRSHKLFNSECPPVMEQISFTCKSDGHGCNYFARILPRFRERTGLPDPINKSCPWGSLFTVILLMRHNYRWNWIALSSTCSPASRFCAS